MYKYELCVAHICLDACYTCNTSVTHTHTLRSYLHLSVLICDPLCHALVDGQHEAGEGLHVCVCMCERERNEDTLPTTIHLRTRTTLDYTPRLP
jgi:hypothetical protein